MHGAEKEIKLPVVVGKVNAISLLNAFLWNSKRLENEVCVVGFFSEQQLLTRVTRKFLLDG
jgi:hypothetical protein